MMYETYERKLLMSAVGGTASFRTFSCGSQVTRLDRAWSEPGCPVSCCFALPWAGVPRRMQSELFRPGYERVKVDRRNVAFLFQSHDFSYS